MKKIVLISCLVFLLFHSSLAQRRNGLIGRETNKNESIEFTLGPGYCFGDQFTSPANMPFVAGDNWDVSLGYRRVYSNNFGYKATVQYGNYTGFDEPIHAHGVGYFSFNSNVVSVNFRGEYAYGFGRDSRSRPDLFSLYSYLGLGILNSSVTFASNAYQGKPNTIPQFCLWGLD